MKIIFVVATLAFLPYATALSQDQSIEPKVDNVNTDLKNLDELNQNTDFNSQDYADYTNLSRQFFPNSEFLSQMASGSSSGFLDLYSGIGTDWIDGELHYTFRLRPVFKFWKFKIGLNGTIRINQKGQIRERDWSEGIVSYLRILDFVQYGDPFHSFYARVGLSNKVTIGNGTIMNGYLNTLAYDLRKPSLDVRLNFPMWGLHVFLSDFTDLPILGQRTYVRPLKSTGIPIISGLEVGLSTVADLRHESGYVGNDENYQETFNLANANKKTPVVFGADIAIPILSFDFWNLKVISDYIHFLDYGNGLSAGIATVFNIGELLRLSVRFEHREAFGRMLFGYFNGFYESKRYEVKNEEQGTISTYLNSLDGIGSWRGFRASAAVNVIGKIIAALSYESPYDSPRASQFYAYVEAPNVLPMFAIKLEYFKYESDFNLNLFVLDQNSRANLRISYKAFGFFFISVISQWTFLPVRSETTGDITSFTPFHQMFFRTGVSVSI